MKLKNLCISLSAALALLAGLGACAQDDNTILLPPEITLENQFYDSGLPVYEAYETRSEDGLLATEVIDTEAVEGSFEIGGSVCECTTDKCRQAWLSETFGCGLCVTVVCDDGSMSGGCSFCPEGN